MFNVNLKDYSGNTSTDVAL
jgi:hypothetical protein